MRKLLNIVLSSCFIFVLFGSVSFAHTQKVTVAGISNQQDLASTCAAQGMTYNGNSWETDSKDSSGNTWFKTTGQCVSMHHHHHHHYRNSYYPYW